MNETINQTINGTVSNINLASAKGVTINILSYIHSGGLFVSNFLAKYIPLESAYIYLILFGLISLWLGAKLVNYKVNKTWWVIISGVIMYLLVWWT